MDDIVDWKWPIADLSPGLYRYFCTSFPPAIADDLVQETVLRLVNKVRAGQYDANKGSLRMFAYGIAHFVRLEAMRGPRFEELPDEVCEVPVSNQDDLIDDSRQRARLRKAISSLSEIQQRIIGLYMDDEISIQEMSLILELPEGTVKSHIHRAKEALKEKLVQKRERKS